MTSDCLFCKAVDGDIPVDVVASTDTTLAFRDIDPQAPTHVLVVPRKHVVDADSIGDDDGQLLADVFSTAREVARLEGLTPEAGAGGYRLVFNVGPDSNNQVPHLHLHVLGGRKLDWPPG